MDKGVKMTLNISNIYRDEEENLYLLYRLLLDDKSLSSEVEPSSFVQINNERFTNNYLLDEELRRAIKIEEI